jgi:hypothetical protein
LHASTANLQKFGLKSRKTKRGKKMKKSNFVGKLGISVSAIAIAFVASFSVSAQLNPGSDQGFNRIVGAWETTVQPRDCNTGEPIGQPFPGVLTFNLGGTVAEFGANPAVPHRTPGTGVWTSEGRGIYTLRFSFIPLTPQGVPIGRLRVTQVGELSRFSDEQTSSGSFTLTNFQGVVIGSGCSTATAVRLD